MRALLVALSTTLAVAPLTTHAAPEVSEAAQKHYEDALRERDAGNHAAAAAEFDAAYQGIPPARKELRASVLFDLVAAHRAAFDAGGRVRGREHPAAHLCAAEKTLAGFIAEMEKERRPKAKKSPDTVKAEELRADVKTRLDGVRADTPDLDCETAVVPTDTPDEPAPPPPEPVTPPEPARPRPNLPLVIAGAVTTGVGLIMIGVMAGGMVRGKRAEADGNALVDMNPTLPSTDPALQDIDHRGKVGNRMAIAGGVLGGLCLGAGITMLTLGALGKPRRVAAAPYATRESAGLTLRWQF